MFIKTNHCHRKTNTEPPIWKLSESPSVVVQHMKEIRGLLARQVSHQHCMSVSQQGGRHGAMTFFAKGFYLLPLKEPWISHPSKSTREIRFWARQIKNTTQKFCLKSLANADDFYICPNYIFHFYCTSTWYLKSSINQKPQFIFTF